jgi:hypothetical protein
MAYVCQSVQIVAKIYSVSKIGFAQLMVGVKLKHVGAN